MGEVKLTERDKHVLEFVKTYISAHCYAPSYREIGSALNMASLRTVHKHIKKLLKLGELETDHPESPRAFRAKGQKVII